MVAGLVVLARRKLDWASIFNKNSAIVILFVYFGLSIIWSPFLDVSLKRWIRSLGDLIMVLVVLTESDPLEATSKLIRRCAFVLLPLSVLLIKYFRELGVSYDYFGTTMWVGVTTHKNSLGQLSCICAIYFLWNIIRTGFKKRIRLDVVFLLMALWLLNGSGVGNSKTSVFAFLVGIFILVSLYVIKPKNIGIYLPVLAIGIGLTQFLSDLVFQTDLWELLLKIAGKNPTLTGRTQLWKELISLGMYNPILGSGYGGFWLGDTVGSLFDKFEWEPNSAHNGYIDVFVNLGFIGVLLLMVVIYRSYSHIMKTLMVDSQYGKLRMVFFIMILVFNYSESSFTKPTVFLWFVFLLIALEMPAGFAEKT
jgi:exopolysaccharide production protein ExoQ